MVIDSFKPSQMRKLRLLDINKEHTCTHAQTDKHPPKYPEQCWGPAEHVTSSWLAMTLCLLVFFPQQVKNVLAESPSDQILRGYHGDCSAPSMLEQIHEHGVRHDHILS